MEIDAGGVAGPTTPARAGTAVTPPTTATKTIMSRQRLASDNAPTDAHSFFLGAVSIGMTVTAR